MVLCSTGPQFRHAIMFELQLKHLQLYAFFFSHRADQIKQAPAPAQSWFNLHGPRCQSSLTTPHPTLPHPSIHPSISHLTCYARTPSLWVHSHIVVSPGPAVNSQYMPPPPSAITYLSGHPHRDETACDKSCARVHEAATPPAGWMGKKHPTLLQPEENR